MKNTELLLKIVLSQSNQKKGWTAEELSNASGLELKQVRKAVEKLKENDRFIVDSSERGVYKACKRLVEEYCAKEKRRKESERRKTQDPIDRSNPDSVVSKLSLFFSNHKKKEVIRAMHNSVGEHPAPLFIKYKDFDEFDTRFGDLIEENLEDFEDLVKTSLKDVSVPEIAGKNPSPYVIVTDIPIEIHLVRDLRADQLKRCISIVGRIKKATPVRLVVTSIVFECTECFKLTVEIQEGKYIKRPKRCVCGAEKKFQEVVKIPAFLKSSQHNLFDL